MWKCIKTNQFGGESILRSTGLTPVTAGNSLSHLLLTEALRKAEFCTPIFRQRAQFPLNCIYIHVLFKWISCIMLLKWFQVMLKLIGIEFDRNIQYVIHAGNTLASKIEGKWPSVMAGGLGRCEGQTIALCWVQPVGLATILHLVRVNLAQPRTATQPNVQVVLWQPYPMTTGDWTYGHRHIVLTAGKMHKALSWVGCQADRSSQLLMRLQILITDEKPWPSIKQREKETFWISTAAASPSRQGGHFFGQPIIQAASQFQSPLLSAQPIMCPSPPGGMPQCGDVPGSKEQKQESPGAVQEPWEA